MNSPRANRESLAPVDALGADVVPVRSVRAQDVRIEGPVFVTMTFGVLLPLRLSPTSAHHAFVVLI